MMDGAVRQMELSISRSERVILTRVSLNVTDRLLPISDLHLAGRWGARHD